MKTLERILVVIMFALITAAIIFPLVGWFGWWIISLVALMPVVLVIGTISMIRFLGEYCDDDEDEAARAHLAAVKRKKKAKRARCRAAARRQK